MIKIDTQTYLAHFEGSLDLNCNEISKFRNCKSKMFGKINAKIFDRKIILTGCKSREDAVFVLREISMTKEFTLIPVMSLCTFQLPKIDLERLEEIIYHQTDFKCVLRDGILKIVKEVDLFDLDILVVQGENENVKKLGEEKMKKITFNVYHTGKVLLSGLDWKYEKDMVDWLVNFSKE